MPPARPAPARPADVVLTLAGLRAREGPLAWSDIGAALQALGNPLALRAFGRLDEDGTLPPGPDLSQQELRFLSLFLVLAERHDSYHALLRQQDPALDLVGREAVHRFAGTGLAAGALGGCRRIACADGDVFEKIYVRRSPIGRNIVFFYDRLFAQVRRVVDLPALRLLNPGDRLLQCLVAFHDLSGLRPAPLALRLDIIARLAALDTPPPPAAAGALHGDFEGRHWVRRGRETLLSVLAGHGEGAEAARMDARLDALIAVARQAPRYFSHGDLSNSNVFETGLVIDWDVCGRLPFGWDAAWLMRRRLPEDSLARADAFFDAALRQGGARDDLHRFCFLLFLMLFHACERGARSSAPFLAEVFRHLEDRRPLLA